MSDPRIEIDTEYAKAQAALRFKASVLRRAWIRKGDRSRVADVVAWEAKLDESAAIERDLGHHALQLASNPKPETREYLERLQARQQARRDQLLAEIDELGKRIHP